MIKLHKYKKSILTLLVFNTVFVYGQINIQTSSMDKEKPPVNQLDIDAGYYANSNVFTNGFIHDIINKGIIGERSKSQVIRRMKHKGRLGYNFNVGIKYKTSALIKNYNFYTSLAIKDHVFSGFTKNTLKLLLNGNSEFEGEQIRLDPFSYNYLSYEAFTLGIEKLLPAIPFKIYGGISLLKGSNYQAVKISRGDILTATNGSSITIDTKANACFSRGRRKLTNWNGLGASLHFGGSYNLIPGKSKIDLKICDIGAIWWKNMEKYTIDTNYTYKGYETGSLLENTDTTSLLFNPDSLGSLPGLTKGKGKHSSIIPATIQMSYTQILTKKASINCGVRYMLNANYFPRVHITGIYKLPHHIAITTTLNLGGYSVADYGLGFSKIFYQRFQLGCNTFLAERLIAPSISTGQSFFVWGRIIFDKADQE